MSTAGVLDDYLDALLSEAPPAVTAEPVEPKKSTLPSGDNAELEAAFEAALAAREASPAPERATAQVPGDSAELEAAFEAALAAKQAAEATPAPTWDDLPDEVIYETSAAESAKLSHTDSPALQAAFEVAANGGTVPAPAPPKPMPAPQPARATPAAEARPNTWQELQAQAQRASHPAPQRRASEKTSRWLRMRCGKQTYALELLKVQEVVLPVPLLALRGTNASMLGIMNLRGQVVPVLDLCRHLDVATTSEDAQTRIVVLEENGEILGLRVSAVEDVTSLTDSQIEPPDTARICQISNELFRGVARLGSQPMILLDATRLLQ